MKYITFIINVEIRQCNLNIKKNPTAGTEIAELFCSRGSLRFLEKRYVLLFKEKRKMTALFTNIQSLQRERLLRIIS